MSTTLIQQLLDVLAAEERVHRELREVLGSERECMLELDAAGLYELAGRKQALSDEGRLVAEARVEAANRLALALDIRARPLTLARLCEALGDEAGALRDAQSRLLALVAATQEIAEANRMLGGERLSHVQTTLQLLGRLLPDAVHDPARGGGRLVRTSA